MHNSLAAPMGRERFGRLLLTRTADCGTQASCLAAEDPGRSNQPSSYVSWPRAQPRVTQVCPCVFERPLQRSQTCVGSEAPSVPLGSQKGDPVVVVVDLGLKPLDLWA